MPIYHLEAEMVSRGAGSSAGMADDADVLNEVDGIHFILNFMPFGQLKSLKKILIARRA